MCEGHFGAPHDTILPYVSDAFWTNLVAAYQGLSPTMRGFVDRLRAVYANVARANPKPGQQYTRASSAGLWRASSRW